VSAKIPDPKKLPLLFARITKSMFHGPCHGQPCMKDGICSAGYPRPFANCTVNIDGAYPIYKRQDQGITFTKHATTFDNRWVVPYNKLLHHEKNNCHLISSDITQLWFQLQSYSIPTLNLILVFLILILKKFSKKGASAQCLLQ
jgi:hypothetical protein